LKHIGIIGVVSRLSK